jgi:hypothetical protein
MSRQDRLDTRAGQPPWWGLPIKNTLDMATSFIPRLMHERLPEMGLDFAILYPTGSQLFAPYVGDAELRQAACYALNKYAAEMWAEYAERRKRPLPNSNIASRWELKPWHWAV